jgi:hypothetical protein
MFIGGGASMGWVAQAANRVIDRNTSIKNKPWFFFIKFLLMIVNGLKIMSRKILVLSGNRLQTGKAP